MRHDAKLGLALGMLVIGFAVAFCFPRQQQPSSWPRLEAPEPISDRELEFLPMRAYPSPRADAGSSDSSTPNGTQLATVPTPATGPVPEPIAPPEELGKAMPQIAAVEADGPSPSSAASILPGGASSEKPPESPQIYTVKAGDTLSGIASRFLGSGARFLDVYEANRDRLPSPDALQVGQELRIPPKNGGASTLAGAESSSPLNESTTNPPPAGFERPGKPPWMADKPTELPR